MSNVHYDAIVILGRSLNPDSSLVDADKERLEKVVQLYKEGAATAIVVCGLHGYKSIEKPVLGQAQAYANYLERLGIPHSAIFLETKSQETLGNLLFAKMHILMKYNWHTLLVIPTYNHSTERIEYLLKKVLGGDYTWNILRIGENEDPTNSDRETKSLTQTKEINDQFTDGDHEAIYKGLMETHPAYGGTKYTMEELRNELKH